MSQQTSIAVKAGIVILAGLILLLGFSFRSSGRGWFNKQVYEIDASFEAAKGLEVGSTVVLAGVPIGQVRTIAINPQKNNVIMRLAIREPNRIATDAVGTIRLKTLLGNYQLYITPGTPGAPTLEAGTVLTTEDSKDIQDTLQELGRVAEGFGKIGEGSDGLFASIQDDTKALFEQLSQVIEENRENLSKTTASFADAAPKFDELMDSLTRLSQNIEQGKGTLGKLTQDDELYAQVSKLLDNLEQFSNDLNSGKGTLARLMHDEELGNKIDETFTNVSAASGKIRETIDRNEAQIDQALASAGSALPKLDDGMDHFVSIGRKIDEGEGTLGKMVNDPELYDNVRDAVAQIRRTFEEGEEQTVMRTFLGVFFGSVI